MITRFTAQHAFLSNTYRHPVTYEDLTYPTNEHAFAAAKYAPDFMLKTPIKSGHQNARAYIAGLHSWQAAKAAGRQAPLDLATWEVRGLKVMEELELLKFSDPSLADKLLATNDEILIEGNCWHDNKWGDCYCARCATIPGRNLLGEIHMRMRRLLRERKETGS